MNSDLITQAERLVLTLAESQQDLYADYAAEGTLPMSLMQYMARLGHATDRATKRLIRRGGSDPFDLLGVDDLGSGEIEAERDYYNADDYYTEFYSDMDRTELTP